VPTQRNGRRTISHYCQGSDLADAVLTLACGFVNRDRCSCADRRVAGWQNATGWNGTGTTTIQAPCSRGGGNSCRGTCAPSSNVRPPGTSAIWPNVDFQEGSLLASLTRPRARPSWQAPVMRTTADDVTSGQAEHRRPGRQSPQSPGSSRAKLVTSGTGWARWCTGARTGLSSGRSPALAARPSSGDLA